MNAPGLPSEPLPMNSGGPAHGDEPAPRIVSLVPSLSELVFALGLGAHLVGRTGWCVHPAPDILRVPKVGGTKTVNIGRIRRLAPTHVLLNPDENRAETAEALRAFVPNLVVMHPCTPQDNLALIDQMADCFASVPGVRERASRLRAAVADELGRIDPPGGPGEAVLYLIWREPWMTVARDTYISAMLATVGWRTWPDVRGGERGAGRYPAVDLREAAAAGVRRVLLSSEPYAFTDAHRREVARALPGAQVQFIDGEAVSWWGPRVLRGLPYLRALACGAPAEAGGSPSAPPSSPLSA